MCFFKVVNKYKSERGKKGGWEVFHTKKKKAKSCVDDWKPAVTSYTSTVLVPTSPAVSLPLHVSLFHSCSKAIKKNTKRLTQNWKGVSSDRVLATQRRVGVWRQRWSSNELFVGDCLELVLLGRRCRMEAEVCVRVCVCLGVASPRKAPSWRSRRLSNCY